MSKIVAFLGSPRKNGYTAQLMNRILDGAKSAGADVVVYDLNAEGIKGCQGCFYCRSHEDCATKDALYPMYEDIKNADGIVFGSPIYFGTITGQAKLWLDRMYPMYALDFSPRFPGKNLVTVYTQANGDRSCFLDAIDSNNKSLQAFGWDLIDSLHIYGNTAPNYSIPKELLERAFEVGKKLAESRL